MANIGTKSSDIKKEKIEALQQDIRTKMGQFKRFKWMHPIFTFFMRKRILDLKKELFNELEKSHKKVGGKAFESLLESFGIPKNIKDQSSGDILNATYSNFILGTDDNMEPVMVENINQHMVLFGGSGSGKSVFLFNILRQVLEGGGGATFIDGKGDNEMLKDFLSWAKEHDRLDDVYLLDFLPKDENDIDETTGLVRDRTTNTFNLFEAVGTQTALSIIKKVIAGNQKEADFFKQQALNFFDNCGLILRYMDARGDTVHLGLMKEVSDLKSHLVQLIPPADSTVPEQYQVPNPTLIALNKFEGYEKFWIPPTYGAKEGDSYKSMIARTVENYGVNVCLDEEDLTYDPMNPERPQMTEELKKQIGGYAGQELNKLEILSRTYGHIFNSPKSDINFREVIAQSKLVYVRFPSMKIADTAPKLGSFIINAIADAIGDSLGGDAGVSTNPHDLFSKEKLTASPVHPVIMDELGAYMSESVGPLEKILSQARSVNMAGILSSQEMAGLTGGENSLKQKTMSNTMTKVFLKTSDPETVNDALDSVDTTIKVLDDKGELVSKYDKEQISEYLKNCQNGLGIVYNNGFSRFLTTFKVPKDENRMYGMDLLNK